MRPTVLSWSGVALSVLVLSGCRGDSTRPGQDVATTAAPGPAAPGAKVDEIKDAPGRYYGKTVRLAGEVDEVYGDRAFELEGTNWAFNDNITVLTRTPVGFAGEGLTSDDEVVVVGAVRPFVVADVERELGWDIGPDVEVKLSKRPVIVAQSIRRVGKPGVWPAEAATAPVTSTLAVLAQSDPALLAGRKVDLAGERVQALTGKGLWVGPSHMGQVFVLPKEPPKDVQVGDWVRVTGTMQKVPKDAAKEWSLPSTMEGMVTEGMVYVSDAAVTEVAPRAGAQAPGGQGVR